MPVSARITHLLKRTYTMRSLLENKHFVSRSVLILTGLLIFCPAVFAKEQKDPALSVKASPLKHKIETGYKELRVLYKKKEFSAFSEKVQELKSELADPAVDEKYRKGMLNKILNLADDMDDVYEKQWVARERKKAAAMRRLMGQSPGQEPAGFYSSDPAEEKKLQAFKKKRDEESRRIRQEVLVTHPAFKNDETGLADAVIARKEMAAREREFLQSELNQGVEALYRKGVEFYAAKLYASSQENFREVEQLSANYRSVRGYLKKLASMPKVEDQLPPAKKTRSVKPKTASKNNDRKQVVGEALDSFQYGDIKGEGK